MKLRKLIFTIYLCTISSFAFSDNTSHANLFDYLLENNTSSFLLSEKGRVVIDREFKIKNSLKPKSVAFTNLLQHGFVQNRSQEDVASIQKSFVSVLIGIAQQKGLIDINNPVSLYIGKWTQLEEKKEDLITIREFTHNDFRSRCKFKLFI